MKKNSATVQIKQIAEQVGMSPSTVSIVLNGRGDEMRIAKETQRRIQEAARELDYHPNIYARRLRCASGRQPNQIIAIFWNDTFMESSMASFFKGAAAAVEKNGYQVEFVIRLFQDGRLSEHRDVMSIRKYNGIIIAGPSAEDIAFIDGERFDVPLVLSSRFSEKNSSVYADGYLIGKECARLFARKGIRTAGYVGGTKGTGSSSLRELGFFNTCEELGIEVRPEWVCKEKSKDMEGGYLCARKLLSLEEKPEALFVTYDTMALGVLFALMEAGVGIPQQMALVVYGINRMLQQTSPSITVIGSSVEDLGENSVDLLMTIINNNITMPVNRLIQPRYIFGDSFSIQED